MTTLASDPRWQRFNDSTRPCPCCGQAFTGVFDISFDHPDIWPHGNFRDQPQPFLRVGNDKLGTSAKTRSAPGKGLMQKIRDILKPC